MFVLGFVAIVLDLIGVKLVMLRPIESLGSGTAFVIKIVFILAGIIVTYLSKFDWEKENRAPLK